MKALKITLIIIVATLAVLIGVSAYYGGFRKIEFSIVERQPEWVVYESVTGDYGQTPQVTDRVYNTLLNEWGIETYRGFGIFYDNPQDTEKDKMRSDLGCMLENAPDSFLISQIETKFNIKELPEGKFLTTEFPYKGSLSIMFGIMRVYPAMNKYCIEHNIGDSPIMEIYDVPNGKIIYQKEIE